MSLDVSGLTSGLGTMESSLKAKFSNADLVNDPAKLLELQMDANRYQQITNLAASIQSTIKQAVQGIVSKI